MQRRKLECVAVTGAAGFIASHLVEAFLRRGIKVVGLVHARANQGLDNLEFIEASLRSSIEIHAGDIQDPDHLRTAFEGVDTIVHLAAQINVPESRASPVLFANVNISGTHNVLRAARDVGVPRVVIISSSEVYGSASANLISEEHVLCARSPYAATKIAAEKLGEAYYNSYGLGVVVVRPFNTYGPRQSTRAIIPRIIDQAVHGTVIKLGNLEPVRDYVFVTDTVRGLIAASEVANIEGCIFNLATGHGLSVRELLCKIGEVLGRHLICEEDPTQIRPKPFEVWSLIGCPTKANSRLDWSAEVNLEDGLKATIAEFSKEMYQW